MTDQRHDPAEVERLAVTLSDAHDDLLAVERISTVPEAWQDDRIYKRMAVAQARAVLADLQARYVLVPREGAGARVHVVEYRHDDTGRPLGPDDPGGSLSRQVVAYGPWEPAP